MKNKIVKNFSKERNPKQIYNGEFVENVNCKHFYHEPQIELSDWTHAYKKYLLKHDYIRYPSGSNEYFYSSKQKIIHKSDVKMFIDCLELNDFKSFDDFYNHLNKMRVVEFNSNNWKLSKCSCAWYLKNYICSHIIVLASILKPDSVRYPPESMNIKFGANRKR